MKTPAFWAQGGGHLMPLLLSPLACLYGGVSRLHRGIQRRHNVAVPVICVGNVVAGGAGKTPVAIAIARMFIARGLRPHFLSRGYGGALEGPVRVVLDVHKFTEVGDEPLILAEFAPTWVAKDRLAGAETAARNGADVIIMDDGFQNPVLHKDFSLLVLDAEYGVGNGRLLPAGPLRESLPNALGRCDAVVLVEGDKYPTIINRLKINKPVYNSTLIPTASGEPLSGQKVVAFAGIGRPEKFFKSLAGAGCELMHSFSYPDHHVYTADEMMKMVERAAREKAALVTTRKDYVRLPMEARMMVSVFDVDMVFSAPEGLQAALLSLVKGREV
tara:strand:- start:3880 stop:4869 length:990 start_codon:yes stop_codon:yes gene_type:complete